MSGKASAALGEKDCERTPCDSFARVAPEAASERGGAPVAG
jgi:hypothetical protein